MDIISNNKQLSLDENECIKPCGHRWIIKNKKYICEYCKKENIWFTGKICQNCYRKHFLGKEKENMST